MSQLEGKGWEQDAAGVDEPQQHWVPAARYLAPACSHLLDPTTLPKQAQYPGVQVPSPCCSGGCGESKLR